MISNENSFIGSPEDELRVIKSMIEKSKRNAFDNSIYFLSWGILSLIGCFATYLLSHLQLYNYIIFAWAGVVLTGTIITIVASKREYNRTKTKTHLDNSINYLWIGCGVGMSVVGFLGGFSPILTYKAIFPMISLICGIGVFVTGGIIEWKGLSFAGVVFWIATIFMMFTSWNLHPLILAISIIPGYIVPGIVARRVYKLSLQNG